jgi:LEA14-like dessication related protein
MKQINLDRIKKFVMLLSITHLLLFSCNIIQVYAIEQPVVIIVALRIDSTTPPEIPAAGLEIELKIHNPNDVNLILERLEYKIYVNGVKVGDFTPKFLLEEINISPNGTKVIVQHPVVDLSAFDEKTRETFLGGGGEWDITGTAYFSTPMGTLSTPIRLISYELTSRVSLFVKDEKGYSIPSANVVLTSASKSFNGTTNERGFIEFILPPGNYQLRIYKEGYCPYEEFFNLTKPLIIEKVINLVASSPSLPLSKIRIEVEDEKWNRVKGANVTLISKEGTFSGVTDIAGKVEFEIPSTKYTLKIFKESFLPYEEILDLSTPSNVGKIIQIYHAIKLKLEIVDEKGNPIRDANVTFSSKDVGNFTKTTNESGIVEFEIPRIDYTLSVKKKGYLPYEEVLDLSKSPIESKTLQLKPELTWLEQYWSYLLIGVIAICIVVPIVLRLKRRF